MSDPLPELPAAAFDKEDRGDDPAFYAPPRLVTHIDEAAVAALSAIMATRSGFDEVETAVLTDGSAGDPLVVVAGRAPDDGQFARDGTPPSSATLS